MKKVLVLTGSARCNGKTEFLADAFIKGALESGAQTYKFQCASKHIGPCLACNTCYSTGNPCTFSDDFNELAKYVVEADVIVFAVPLYWFTFPASIKLALDKFYSFMVGNIDISNKEAYLLTAGEDDNIESFDGLILSYKQIVSYLKWDDMGHIVVLGADDIEDISKTDYAEVAYNMGKSL